jgi:hypothetical protein
MKRSLSFLPMLLAAVSLFGQESASPGTQNVFKPEIQGTVRAKYEYQPEIDAGRFQVRNARVSVSGFVNPKVEYKAEVDLSDEGNIRMLDAFTSIEVLSNLSFAVGQMRVPFTFDAVRSPHSQYFANRSFIGKQFGNFRDVGAKIDYRLDKHLPLRLEVGIFNGSGLTEQKIWHNNMSYSGKAQFTLIKGMNMTLGALSIKPEQVRMNLLNIGLNYKFLNFHVEGEYLFKTYTDDLFDDVSSINSFICYDLKLKKFFEKISFLCRYDMLTDNSNGYLDPETTALKTTDYSRQRITGGITLSIDKDKPFISDIRLNYENYFYKKEATPKVSEQGKFVIEFMTRF